jgi:hypothetical protein
MKLRTFYLVLAAIAAIHAIAFAVDCQSAEPDGILVEERVINLPQDQLKWYISVVGDGRSKEYARIVSWFDSHKGLRELKQQVHFRKVTTGTSTYRERYATNVSGLPTVRMQQAAGEVMYEASGEDLPITADGLHSAMAKATGRLFPLFPWKKKVRPVLPYDRKQDARPCPGPSPCPAPEPIEPPEEDPLPDFTQPVEPIEVETGIPVGVVVALCVAVLVLGGLIGLGVGLRANYSVDDTSGAE